MQIAALYCDQGDLAGGCSFFGQSYHERTFWLQIPVRLHIDPARGLVAYCELDVLDPMAWTHHMESFAYRYLDRKRLAGFYRCRRRDRRGVRFFKGSFLGLVLYTVKPGKERLVYLDREKPFRRRHRSGDAGRNGADSRRLQKSTSVHCGASLGCLCVRHHFIKRSDVTATAIFYR